MTKKLQTQTDIASNQQVISAINQMFAEFQLVYNNQYHKAFPTTDKLEYTKRLWYGFLKEFSAQQILDAAHTAIKESEFLPTVRGVLKYLETSSLAAHGLPEVRLAYMEACNATHPKADFHWSHPAVYLAGHDCGWLFLESAPEKQSFPLFQQIYKKLCDRVQAGESFTVPKTPALPADIEKPLNKKERLSALAKLRKETGF
jgi:hypothetical protein